MEELKIESKEGQWVTCGSIPGKYAHNAKSKYEALLAISEVVEAERPGEFSYPSRLCMVKGAKFEQIDARTAAIVEAGFSYEGAMYSLSLNSQIKLQGMLVLSAHLSYPIVFNSLDDNSTAVLDNATELTVFVGTAANTMRAILDSGTALKDLVRAATTEEGVAAIVDNR